MTIVNVFTAFAGATVPYSGESESSLSVHNYTASCNRPCNCSMDVYDPVCGDDNITYYSPCYAGCMSLNENKVRFYVMHSLAGLSHGQGKYYVKFGNSF